MKVKVVESILSANDAVARSNREVVDKAGVLALNLMSAPGSGKTTLLENTIPALAAEGRSAVLVGDLQTSRDAERLGVSAAEVTQINTGRGCHLSATQVSDGLKTLEFDDIAYLFIENVGNLVCPASFDLGEHLKVVLLSTTEGDDKVAKYPTMFQPADVVLLTKIDLIPYLDFDINRVKDDLKSINSKAPLFEIASKTGEGMEQWLEWLRNRRSELKK
jgi:hydrogenase nickel incorporation protein HypB